MKKAITFFSITLAILFNGCDKETCKEKPCKTVCITLYDPVCGCNNKTYGNSCDAECYGITEYTYGECQ